MCCDDFIIAVVMLIMILMMMIYQDEKVCQMYRPALTDIASLAAVKFVGPTWVHHQLSPLAFLKQ